MGEVSFFINMTNEIDECLAAYFSLIFLYFYLFFTTTWDWCLAAEYSCTYLPNKSSMLMEALYYLLLIVQYDWLSSLLWSNRLFLSINLCPQHSDHYVQPVTLCSHILIFFFSKSFFQCFSVVQQQSPVQWRKVHLLTFTTIMRKYCSYFLLNYVYLTIFVNNYFCKFDNTK